VVLEIVCDPLTEHRENVERRDRWTRRAASGISIGSEAARVVTTA
jgi:hypothetical protein